MSKACYKTSLADLATALAAVDKLDKVGDEKFGNQSPSFSTLRKALDEPRRALQALLDAAPDR